MLNGTEIKKPCVIHVAVKASGDLPSRRACETRMERTIPVVSVTGVAQIELITVLIENLNNFTFISYVFAHIDLENGNNTS